MEMEEKKKPVPENIEWRLQHIAGKMEIFLVNYRKLDPETNYYSYLLFIKNDIEEFGKALGNDLR